MFYSQGTVNEQSNVAFDQMCSGRSEERETKEGAPIFYKISFVPEGLHQKGRSIKLVNLVHT